MISDGRLHVDFGQLKKEFIRIYTNSLQLHWRFIMNSLLLLHYWYIYHYYFYYWFTYDASPLHHPFTSNFALIHSHHDSLSTFFSLKHMIYIYKIAHGIQRHIFNYVFTSNTRIRNNYRPHNLYKTLIHLHKIIYTLHNA